MKPVTMKVTMDLSREEMSLIGYAVMFLAENVMPELKDDPEHRESVSKTIPQLPQTANELVKAMGDLVEKMSIAIEDQVLHR